VDGWAVRRRAWNSKSPKFFAKTAPAVAALRSFREESFSHERVEYVTLKINAGRFRHTSASQSSLIRRRDRTPRRSDYVVLPSDKPAL